MGFLGGAENDDHTCDVLEAVEAEGKAHVKRGDYEMATLLEWAAKHLSQAVEDEEELRTLRTPDLAREQACGCLVCQCGDVERCNGCGAKMCETADCVLREVNRPRAIYVEKHPLLTRAEEAEARAAKLESDLTWASLNFSELNLYPGHAEFFEIGFRGIRVSGKSFKDALRNAREHFALWEG